MKRFWVIMVLLKQELEDLDKWSFNIFRVAEFANSRPLSCIMYAIFQVKTIAYTWSVRVCAHVRVVLLFLLSRCSSGARAVEDISYPSRHLCHLRDDPGGPLPWKRSVPQQPPCCRCHPVHTCSALHTCSWCRSTHTHTNTHLWPLFSHKQSGVNKRWREQKTKRRIQTSSYLQHLGTFMETECDLTLCLSAVKYMQTAEYNTNVFI